MKPVARLTIAIWLTAALFASAANATDLVAVQQGLAARGYEVGGIDGVIGPRTRAAIRAFEMDHDLPVTGDVSDALLRKLAPPRRLDPIVLRPPNPAVLQGPDRQPKIVIKEPKIGPSPAPSPPAATYQNRNWLVRDLDEAGQPFGTAFAIFLEADGKIAGPRFSRQMRWREEDGALLVSYENAVGMRIERRGRLVDADRIAGEAVGPDDNIWRWIAEAKRAD